MPYAWFNASSPAQLVAELNRRSVELVQVLPVAGGLVAIVRTADEISIAPDAVATNTEISVPPAGAAPRRRTGAARVAPARTARVVPRRR